jgi:hypothetical protein
MALLLYLSFSIFVIAFIDRLHLRGERRALVALTILPLLFTGRALFTNSVYAPADIIFSAQPHEEYADSFGVDAVVTPALSDISSLMIPWRAAVRDSIARGEWPLWNPYMLSGDVLQAASEPAPYHPIRLLSLLLPLDVSLTFEAAALLFLFAASMYLFLRGKAIAPLPALAGAAIWSFSDFLTFYLEYPMGAAVGVLPFVLFAIDRLFAGSRFALLILATPFTLIILAGHPESTLHLVAIAIVYFVARMVTARSLSPLPAGIAAGLLAAGVCAIFLLPFLEALPQTMELSFRESGPAPVSAPVEESMTRLLPAFFPMIHGDQKREVPHDLAPKGELWSGFAGHTPWLLFAAGAISIGRRSIPWLLVASFGLLAGAQTRGLMEAISMLPLFDIALNERLVFLVPLAIAGMSAMALQRLAGTKPRVVACVVAIIWAFLMILAWRAAGETGLSDSFREMHLTLSLATLATFCIVVATTRSARILAVALFALLVTERVAYRATLHPTLPRASFYPVVPVLKAIQDSSHGARIVAAEFTLVPNIPTMYGLRDVRGFEGMTNRRLFETFPLWSVHQPVWFNRVDRLDSPMLSMMNVKHALAPLKVAVPAGWRAVMEERGVRVLRNDTALPAVFAPRRIHLSRAASAIEKMRTIENFADLSVIETQLDEQVIANDVEISGWKRRGSGYRIDVQSRNGGWIVVSETAWKGWRASTGSATVPVEFANHAFVGLKVPAGVSEIELVYFPRSFAVGGIVSAISAVIFFVLLWRSRRTKIVAASVFFIASTALAETWVAPLAGNIRTADGSRFSTTVRPRTIVFGVFDAGDPGGSERSADQFESREGVLSALEAEHPFEVVIVHRKADGRVAGTLRYPAASEAHSLRAGDEAIFAAARGGFRTNLAIFESSGRGATVEIESRRGRETLERKSWTLAGHEMRFLPQPDGAGTRVLVRRGAGRVAVATFSTDNLSGALAAGVPTIRRQTGRGPTLYYSALFGIALLALVADRFRRGHDAKAADDHARAC